MSTDRLKIYNGALSLVGERRLATLTENREPRRLLDEVWQDGGVRFCLEQAQWKFAMRTQKLTYDPGIQPDFGYQRVFQKPDDWVATTGVWQDEYLTTPLLYYSDEGGFWYASLDNIYVRYVSDDANFGTNYSIWPSSFTDYVKAYFASKIVMKLTGAQSRRDEILKKNTGILDKALMTSKNKDAQSDPTKFPPKGNWVRSRWGGRTGRSDRGNPDKLIG